MKLRAVISFLAIIFSVVGVCAEIVRHHFGVADGLSNERVRHIMQDSNGYIWIATWSGVDRFDGYRFINFRTYADDSVRLDHNRVERLAEAPDGGILLKTYTGRVYLLDTAYGSFSLASPSDSAAFDSMSVLHNTTVSASLSEYRSDNRLRLVDADGNIWEASPDGGIDCITEAPAAFRFIESNPLNSEGRDIHVVYAAPDGILWTASRDTRVTLYDRNGMFIGNLAPDGRIVADPSLPFGRRVYAIIADDRGRIWLGTKQKELVVLTPAKSGRYVVESYIESDTPGALNCGDIYGFAPDARGDMWLATFGKGVAKAVADSAGRMKFLFPRSYDISAAPRVRCLTLTESGIMVGATTSGVLAFDPHASDPDRIRFSYHAADPECKGSLSNNDILGVLSSQSGAVYFAAFSGGLDSVASASDLIGPNTCFGNRSVRTGLDADPVLSVVQDCDGDFWLASRASISRYTSSWEHKATYNAGNAGREFILTEAAPQLLDGFRIAFGMRGGVLIVDPRRFSDTPMPRLAVTAVDTNEGHIYTLPSDSTIVLSRGHGDVSLHFAALAYGANGNITYGYRINGADSRWISIGKNRSLHLSGLPSGINRIEIYWTDPYGRLTDNPVRIAIEVPRSYREIAGDIAITLLAAIALAAVAFMLRREMSRRRRKATLEHYIALELFPDTELRRSDDTGTMTGVCAQVGRMYTDSTLKAESISRELGLGRSELRRHVKDVISVSLEDFIRLVRLRAAGRLLAEGKLNVAEVAYRCGFSSPQYMAMLFKEHTGMSPSKYADSQCKKNVSN